MRASRRKKEPKWIGTCPCMLHADACVADNGEPLAGETACAYVLHGTVRACVRTTTVQAYGYVWPGSTRTYIHGSASMVCLKYVRTYTAFTCMPVYIYAHQARPAPRPHRRGSDPCTAVYRVPRASSWRAGRARGDAGQLHLHALRPHALHAWYGRRGCMHACACATPRTATVQGRCLLLRARRRRALIYSRKARACMLHGHGRPSARRTRVRVSYACLLALHCTVN